MKGLVEELVELVSLPFAEVWIRQESQGRQETCRRWVYGYMLVMRDLAIVAISVRRIFEDHPVHLN